MPWLRWVLVGLGLVLLAAVVVRWTSQPPQDAEEIGYSTFLARVASDRVASADIHQGSGEISGLLVDEAEFTAQGPPGGLPDSDIALMDAHDVDRTYAPEQSNPIGGLLLYLLPFLLIGGLLFWMSRRATSQMTGMTAFTRSRGTRDAE